jgi:hypothetical protein
MTGHPVGLKKPTSPVACDGQADRQRKKRSVDAQNTDDRIVANALFYAQSARLPTAPLISAKRRIRRRW